MAWSSGHGDSPISPASLLKRVAYSSRRSRDRASPLSAFSRNTMRAPSCVDIFRERPFSFTLTGTLRMRFTSVARLRTPLRRPAGLPDWPARNWVCCGGLRYPTSYPSPRVDTASLRSDMFFSPCRCRPRGPSFWRCAWIVRPRERPTAVGVERGTAGQPLPALDAGIDEDRIELDDTGAAAGPFCRYQRRAGAAKGIEDHAAAVGTVADRVGNHGDWLDGRMEGKLALRCPVQCVLADIVPNIGPVPAIAPERYVVDVRSRADLEHEDELVLGTIERAHAGIRLVPDAQVLEFGVDLFAGGQHLSQVPPVHAHEMNGAVDRVARCMAEGRFKKRLVLRRGELARRHEKVGMFDGAQSRGMAIDDHVVGHVGEYHLRLLGSQHAGIALGL